MDYKKFFGFLEENGFEMVDKFNDCDRKRTGAGEHQWCGTWIDHFAWRLKGSAPDLQLNSNAQTDISVQGSEGTEAPEKTQEESEGKTEDKAEGATEDASDGEKEAETEDKADATEETEEGEKEAETEDKVDQTEEGENEAEAGDKADETGETKEGEEKEVAEPAEEKAEEAETDDKPADDEDTEEGEKVIEAEVPKKDEKKGNELDTLGAALTQRKASLTKAGHTRQEVNKDPKVVQMVSRLRLLKTRTADAEAVLSGGQEKANAKEANTKKAHAKKAAAKKAPAKKAPAKRAAAKGRGGKGRL